MRGYLSLFFISVLLCLSVLAGCQKTTSFAVEEPAGTDTSQPSPPLQLSTITLPITIPVSALEGILNQQLTGVIYQDDDLQDDDLMVKVTKAGPMKLRSEFSKLSMEVPLKIWARGRWQWNACELCKKLQKTEETEFEVTVRTESRLQLQPDYTLKSYTSGDFAWGARKPTLSLGPLKLNLAPFIEPKLKTQLAPMLQQLDQELQRRVPLPTYLNQAWRQLQTPLLLNEQYNTWLSIEPQAVRLTPLELQQNQLSLQVGIDAFVKVLSGQKPAQVKTAALPNFTPTRTLPPLAQLNIASDISYDYLNQVLQKELRNQRFSFENDKHQLTVHDITLSGKGTKLLLALDLSGQTKAAFLTKKFNGKVWLQGTPFYDAASQSIQVKDLEYTLQTKDQLVNTAQWLLQNRFKAELEKQMVFPVKKQLTTIREALQSGLKENQLQERFLLRGADFSFEPDTLYLTPTGIQAHFLASGQLTLSFQ
ncbi:DUF4403 family protein [Rufibacter latericius]|uniref:DUF4403 family protein n=1 Tax=Rufibacter latericius TaxID=2487040 RepID=A0A3M9MV40_9BACT|nr:DUF4403 family protein [Rufibacter latericius]RNI28773.1 DUF4403 family protein [Rufibacter latericius]